ncbi:PKD domain-containing protein [Spiractinospora alimapuensis]|uniref:PKD domain-containing protein n=1 Tax=Spiractinospora alimapuensis TaxID=2820884 RepID=UPI001F31149E|nr:PKD domain-containing protein [Spiractinospora alimapuensis]QVQ52722.1 PKD domain-containing protein [Spiractinospora alimapuensis]
MLRKASIPAGTIALSGVLVSSFASPAFADSPADQGTEQLTRWVAMGDSFQSGVGAGEYDEESGDCQRSPLSHVRLLNSDGTIPGELDFVACSGARIDDLYAGRHGEAPQLDALDGDGANVSHVSVGIGGNDLDFADNLRDCIVYGWPWASCESRFDENVDAAFQELLDQDANGLNSFQRLYTDIRTATGEGDTQLLAVTYPKFFPVDGGSDWTSIPTQSRCQGIRVSDQLWINNWVNRLNTAVSESAESVGAVPLDLYQASDGHELCNSDGNDPYLNGIQLNSDAFHPTEFGYARNAEAISAQLASVTPQPVPLRAAPVAALPEPPTAAVDHTQDGAQVTFDGSGSVPGDGDIVSYLWEFDDGQLVEGAEVEHTYEPGTYYVTLTVIDSFEEMGFSEPVKVVVE